MELSTEERNVLKAFREHAWFNILEKINQCALNDLTKMLMVADLNDQESLAIIQKNQLYLKARSDFLYDIDSHIQDIQESQVKLM